MIKDSLGYRMKSYEQISSHKLIPNIAQIIRIDGRAFHTITKHFEKPFDRVLIKTMQETAIALCEEVTGCRFAYTESDEISLLIYPKNPKTSEPFFDAKIQKLCSITASIATMAFYKTFRHNVSEYEANRNSQAGLGVQNAYDTVLEKGINFDSRCFNLPKEEVVNYFIWRQQDATRNSIQMLARSLYSHKELQNKKFNDLNELCFAKGVNFDKLPTVCKRGTGIFKVPTSIKIDGQAEPIIRDKWWIDEEMPIITENREYISQHLEVVDECE